MAIEQRPLFAEPVDRVWETFVAERTRYLASLFRNEPRKLARVTDPLKAPKFTRERRVSLAALVSRCGGEEPATRAVVGAWYRDSPRVDLTNTTIEMLFRADDGYLERLMGWGDDELDRRAEKLEREAERRAANAARPPVTAEQLARSREDKARADALKAELRAEAEARKVVPIRRSGT